MIRRSTPSLAIAALFCLASGCSGDSASPGVELVPCKGRVLVDDQPLAEATVALKPAFDWPDPKLPHPHATTDENGLFVLGTFSDHDGAPAGTYQVSVTLPSTEGLASISDPIGKTYADPASSGLKITVAADTAELPDLKLKGRKLRLPAQAKGSKR